MTTSSSQEAVDFLIHSRVRIAAPPATIWPFFAKLNWMSAPKLKLVSGEPGSVGARFEAYLDDAMETVAYHVVNAEVTPDVRRVIRIVGLDGVAMGFTAFESIPCGPETIAAYDVYLRMILPDGQQAPDFQAVQQASDGVMLELKALVESERA